MSDNRLNLTGLTYFYNRLKQVFATQTALNTLSERVDDIVAEGGEPNKIDTISVNGTNVPPDAQKNVELTVQETLVSGTNIKTINNESLLGSGNIDIHDVFVATHGTTTFYDIKEAFEAGKIIVIKIDQSNYAVPVRISTGAGEYLLEVVKYKPTPALCAYLVTYDTGWITLSETVLAEAANIPDSTSDLNNDGDGNSPFATEAYVGQNGGKIDTISVNGTQQTITNKNVDITVPTKVSDLTNDGDGTTGSTFPTTAQMQTAIDAKISSAYKAKGSVAFANLPALTAANEGGVYNVTDSFTTTADFVEGAGNTHPAGTNVVIINTGTEQSPVYKYDVLAGFVDLSNYWNSTNLTAITTAEIDAMMAS